MNTVEFVNTVNKLRLANKDKWFALAGTVNGCSFEIKGFGTWLQVMNVNGINYANCMEQSVAEFKQYLKTTAEEAIKLS